MLFFHKYTLNRKQQHIAESAVIVVVTFVLAIVLKMFVVDAVFIPSPSMEQTLIAGDFVIVNKLIHGSSSQKNDALMVTEASLMNIPALRQVEQGDVIVFHLPSDEQYHQTTASPWFVKRCIARSGDNVLMRNGRVYVNGSPVLLPSNKHLEEYPSVTSNDFRSVRVPRSGDVIDLSEENYHDWESFIKREGHIIDHIPSLGIFIDGHLVTSYTVSKNYLFVLGDNRSKSFDSRSWGFLPEENVIGLAAVVYWSMDKPADENDQGDFFSSIRWGRIGTLIW